jgi:hypothetical protein
VTYFFGLDDVKIAGWNSAENWDAAVDLKGVHEISLELNTVNGVLEGDDEILAAHAKIISGSFSTRFAFETLAPYAILTGNSVSDSVSTDSIIFDTTDNPYFGLCGRILDVDGAKDLHLFLPKAKVMESITIGGQYGQFVTPQVSGRLVRDGATYGVCKLIIHDTAQAVTIPPT